MQLQQNLSLSLDRAEMVKAEWDLQILFWPPEGSHIFPFVQLKQYETKAHRNYTFEIVWKQ